MSEADFGESKVPFTESKVVFPVSDRVPWERGEFGEDQLTALTRQIAATLEAINKKLEDIEEALWDARRVVPVKQNAKYNDGYRA